MKSLNLNLSPSWSHLDIVPSRATWNTRTERKTWTDQLVNGPRFHEIAIQLWRRLRMVAQLLELVLRLNSNRTTPVYIQTVTVYIQHVLSVHNAGSTRGEASMAKREARIDVSLETSRISRYDTFTLHTLVKVGKHDTQQVMPMVYRQSIFRFVRWSSSFDLVDVEINFVSMEARRL